MERWSILLIIILCRVAGAFIATPTSFTGRCSTIGLRKANSNRRSAGGHQHARSGWPRAPSRSPGAAASTRMNLVLLAEEDVPIIPAEQLESIVSFLSVASSALLLFIVVGAVYLTYSDWQSKRDIEKAEQFIAKTGELPELADQKMPPAGAPSKDGLPEEVGGNRQFRRLAKKEKKKFKS